MLSTGLVSRIAVALFVAALIAPGVSEAAPITVEQAVAAAEAKHPAIAEAVARVDQARGRRTTAGQWVPSRPELDLGFTSDAPFAREGEATFEVTLGQRLELFGQRGLRVRVAREDLRARSLEVADGRRRIQAEVRVAFYELMFQERRGELAAEVVEAASRLVDSARQRVAAGDLGDAELQLLVADLALARSELRAAHAAAGVARAGLNRLIGEDATADTTTAGDFPALADREDASALVERATADRPDLAAAARDVASARAEVDLRRRERLPDVTVVAGYSFERSLLGGDDFEPALSGGARDDDHLFTIGLALPLPLFRSNAGEIAEARGRAAEAEARRAGVAGRAAEEVVAASARRAAARARIAELEEAATAVTATLDRYERAWTEKHIDLGEYLAIRDRVLAVQVSALEARRDGAVADAELDAATGAGGER